jgi:hypothetical protein
VKTTRERSRFAQRFQRVYRDATLPRVYRAFITSDAYLPYRRSFIQGLETYGPTDVELNLSAPILLKRNELFGQSDIDPDDATEFHPIAILRESPQFLAVKTTEDAAPVYLWHHETGAFHPQFDTFASFLKNLRTAKEARGSRAKSQRGIASIHRDCGPALLRAREHFQSRELEAASAELDAALRGRHPIAYNGRNDFEAVGILCDCFNLRGRIFLSQGRLEAARAAFLDAMACGGRSYREAVVDAVVTSFLLEDVEPVVAEVSGLDPAHFIEPPGSILRRNFTAHQIVRLTQAATAPGLSEGQRGVARQVLDWVSSARA